ncbi:hypothetical protein G7A72_03550 [Flavobacterium sp. Sr18]|uniref:hypothetical protein n=1 Tax=Flavobacterium sp. Sr18 TaxID=935222 RepID=UPI0013E4A80B|nr:hypothetical protein [Flavobacterium sp. Sr18]QIH37932.1 hypothetical protein G7A72_03550 [Flavobacterium sp. Sr18]
MGKLLNSAVAVKRLIDLKVSDSISTTGFLVITTTNIEYIELLLDNEIVEVLTVGEPDDIKNIFKEDINDFIGVQVYLEIRIGRVNCYFETVNDFLNGNKFKLKSELFYIAENDYYSHESTVVNELVNNYCKNIELIDFLNSLSHSQHHIGNQLKYYFYRISNNIVEIDIKYSENDLIFFSDLQGLQELKNEFSGAISHKDKKELFINELVNFIESNSSDYLTIVKNWNTILSSYNRSYKLYLAGFSFEKIKTASNEHFQKLLNSIYDSISKVSGYIFGIPIGFILLLNYFDYTGSLIFKNIVILILSILFFVLIWFILLRNIKESIEAIETDIDDFIKLINTVPVLNPYKEKLESLKTDSIKKQRNKLLIVKGVTISIFALTVIVFFFIFFDVSVYL